MYREGKPGGKEPEMFWLLNWWGALGAFEARKHQGWGFAW